MNKQNLTNWSKMKTQNLFFVKTCDEQLIKFISKHCSPTHAQAGHAQAGHVQAGHAQAGQAQAGHPLANRAKQAMPQ
jgi:hypothetical protein